MTPLPEHEREKVVIDDFIKAILEELELEFFSLGSTTLKNEFMSKGIEPDDYFYIQNEAVFPGKERLDLMINPLPNLVL